MSEAYLTETELVRDETNLYDRGMDAAIALGFVGFVVGLVTLVGLVPLDARGAALRDFYLALVTLVIGGVGLVALSSWANVTPVESRRVRGLGTSLLVTTLGLAAAAILLPVTLATTMGLVLLVEALALVGAGAASRMGLVDTAPNRSAGLLAAAAFGTIGLVLGSAFGVSLFGFDSAGWIVAALVAGPGLGGIAVLPREDVGSTLPAAVVVGVLGGAIATSAIGVGWTWNPQRISGGFTGGVVVPVFLVLGTLLTAWSAAKCRAGFGARGREYGAFLVVNLNAFLMMAVMVAVVLFVTVKGVGYALHGFTVGALSALVLLSPLLVAVVRAARTPAGTGDWNPGVRQLFRLFPLAAVGAVAAALVSVAVTGARITYPYVYYVGRDQRPVDTELAVTPDLTVGALVLVLPALVLFGYFYRRYGSLENVGTENDTVDALRRAAPAAFAFAVLLVVGFAAVGPSPAGVPLGATVGGVAVVAGAVAAGVLAVLPLAGTVAGEGETLADRAQAAAPLFTVGVFGGLGIATAVVFLQRTARVVPGVGPVDVVSAVASLAALASIGTTVVVWFARRGTDEDIQRRLLGEAVTLGLAATAGYLALLGLHVAVTKVPFAVFGVAVANEGSLSFPMAFQAYVPLGPEPGGILPAIVGTVWLVVGATLFAVPFGVGAAIFLTEYAEQGRFTALVEIATNALWSTPSVVFGLFGAAFLIPRLGGDESLLAGMLVLGFMLLPLVLITSREAIKAVPTEYRDGSAALGVDRWETIRSVVLPAALPGVVTGAILGIGRIAGETAPLILVLGSTLNAPERVKVLAGFRFTTSPPFVANDALVSASAALPTQVWAVIAAGVSGSPSMGWASAFLLLAVVLTFYAVGIATRTYFRRKLNYE